MQTPSLQERRRNQLRREIAIGIEQADRGDVAPLNIENIKTEVHQKLKNNPQARPRYF